MNLQQRANVVFDRGTELIRLEQYREALPAFEEACTLYRQLAASESPEFEHNIISSLQNIGNCRSQLGKLKDALVAHEEAYGICERRWNEAAPDARDQISDRWAAVCSSLASTYGELGDLQKALDLTDRLVLLRRRESESGPLQVNPRLADALRLFALARASAGVELNQALSAATEAITIYKELSPDSYEPQGQHLNYVVFAEVLTRLGRVDDAAKVRLWLEQQGGAG